jgi:hypothetical protein
MERTLFLQTARFAFVNRRGELGPNIPLSARCKRKLLHWRYRVGPEYSLFVFPNARTPTRPKRPCRVTSKPAIVKSGPGH